MITWWVMRARASLCLYVQDCGLCNYTGWRVSVLGSGQKMLQLETCVQSGIVLPPNTQVVYYNTGGIRGTVFSLFLQFAVYAENSTDCQKVVDKLKAILAQQVSNSK